MKAIKEKVYDLEERTFIFARDVAVAMRALPRNISNIEYIKQIVRSSASTGANYIEANEALSKKDFVYRVKVCRKEAKESAFFIRLLKATNEEVSATNFDILYREAVELTRIFSAIIVKSTI